VAEVCGIAVLRRVLFNDLLSGDLDVMVPNGDDRAFHTLNRLHVPFEFNRQGHHRYRWNNLQIDLLQPEEFYAGFQDVEASLSFFDLKINALAFHMKSRQLIDPFKVLRQSRVLDPGINWGRWSEMPPFELAILAIRLLKIMHEIPGLGIPTADKERLRHVVLPKIRECDWSNLYNRFPRGKQVFLRMFNTTVIEHRTTYEGERRNSRKPLIHYRRDS
jgi:hypothetical protein